MKRSHLHFVTLLTVGRFPLVLVFFVGAIIHTWKPHGWLFGLSFASLILAAVTDLFDGYFARRLSVVTSFGAYADPLMDKFFYLSTFPLLVFVAGRQGHHGHAAFLLVLTLLFLARDQWVTFLRSIGSLYKADVKANWSGKLRTSVNFPLICVIYYFEAAPGWLMILPAFLVHLYEALGLSLNLVSIYIYTRDYWPHLRRSVSLNPGE